MWNLSRPIHQKGQCKKKHHIWCLSDGVRCLFIHYTLNEKQWVTSFRSIARLLWQSDTSSATESFAPWTAVLYTELWCQCLVAHQHSLHLLCLSLHNYTSWSCFLSPPDHLLPAANLLSVPASASTSSPYWVNLSIDIIFSLPPSLCFCRPALCESVKLQVGNVENSVSVEYTVCDLCHILDFSVYCKNSCAFTETRFTNTRKKITAWVLDLHVLEKKQL